MIINPKIIKTGPSEEQLNQWAAVNTQLEEVIGIYEKETTPTSATYFTFNDNAVLKYVGDDNVEEIVIPTSYSIDSEGNFIDGNDYQVTTIEPDLDGLVSDSFAGTVRILDNIITVGSYAFYSADNLTNVIIGKNVTSIGNNAFNYCENLKTIVFEEPSQLISIGSQVFRNCNNLTSIQIPASVTMIEGDTFRDPTGLTMIDVDDDNQVYSSENGILFNKDKTSLLRYPDQKEDTNYTIPEGVVLLGTNAFSGCDNLVTITIPASMVSTESYVFSNSSNIVNIYYSGTLSSWLNIDFAYYTSNPLCANRGATENNLYIDNNKVTEIKSTDFGDMTTIKSNIFAGYNGLVSVEIPNTITSIEDGAFEYCRGLISIIIPESVTNMGNYAFSDDTALSSITVLAENPPVISTRTFSGLPSNAVFYVPDASVEVYKQATNWVQYADQIQPLSSKGGTN